MLKYMIKDVTATFRFLPYGLAAGAFAAAILAIWNRRRIKKHKKPFSVIAVTGLFMYVVIMLCITFWCRESGKTTGIDLQLFSTWGINTRNNAYVIENILLFLPYGFLSAWVFVRLRNPLSAFLMGILTSTGVELLQLLTARGYFQIDDILTNTLGTVLGYLIFFLIGLVRVKGE